MTPLAASRSARSLAFGWVVVTERAGRLAGWAFLSCASAGIASTKKSRRGTSTRSRPSKPPMIRISRAGRPGRLRARELCFRMDPRTAAVHGHASPAGLRATLDLAPIGLAQFDVAGRLLYVNDRL